jgi:hypothetical protein
MFHKNFLSLHSYHNNNCQQMSIHFCFSSSVSTHRTYCVHNFQYSGPAITACTHSHEMAILLATATEKHWWFSLIISSTWLRFLGCCSWSLTMLLVIQVGMSEAWIKDTCSPTSNNTDVYIIICTDNFHSLMNVNQWNIFCSQKINHFTLVI